MSDRQASVVKLPKVGVRLTSEEVIVKLRDLIKKASSPVVQECLRAARKEIAFLTASEGPFTLDDETYEALSDDEMVKGPTNLKKREVA